MAGGGFRDSLRPHLTTQEETHDRARPGEAEADARDEAFLGWRQAGKLLLQRCGDTGKAYFPPRPFSPYTGTRNVSVFEASGKATLYSYVIHHRPVPGFTPPYAIAVVELEEGPRLMTNIVDCPQTPEALVLDMPLEVTFEAMDEEISLPFFRPAKGGK
ncbi:Zn-ribbon domain-containing OB-fold protein [Siccirubricoccus deserti]